jgi:hypothetical protein
MFQIRCGTVLSPHACIPSLSIIQLEILTRLRVIVSFEALIVEKFLLLLLIEKTLARANQFHLAKCAFNFSYSSIPAKSLLISRFTHKYFLLYRLLLELSRSIVIVLTIRRSSRAAKPRSTRRLLELSKWRSERSSTFNGEADGNSSLDWRLIKLTSVSFGHLHFRSTICRIVYGGLLNLLLNRRLHIIVMAGLERGIILLLRSYVGLYGLPQPGR